MAGLHLPGADAIVLELVDPVLHVARHVARLVQLLLADHLLDQPLLVLAVEDLEARRQAGQLVMQPQQPVRDAVEGAHPHGAARHVEQFLDAVAHLGRGLVGEGDGQDVVGRGAQRADRPGDAMREHAGLAAAGAGQHQRGTGGRGDRGALFIVQRVEDRGEVHGATSRPAGGKSGVVQAGQCTCRHAPAGPCCTGYQITMRLPVALTMGSVSLQPNAAANAGMVGRRAIGAHARRRMRIGNQPHLGRLRPGVGAPDRGPALEEALVAGEAVGLADLPCRRWPSARHRRPW